VIDHPPHVENARRALAAFDAATTGSEIGRLGVKVATALRCLLYEPADGHQGDYIQWEEIPMQPYDIEEAK
jgi:hypothetical protein